MNEILEKIRNFKKFYGEKPQCYHVAITLSSNFGGEVWYDSNHCITLIDGIFYDKKGIVDPEIAKNFLPLRVFGIHVENSLVEAMYESLMNRKLYPCKRCGKKVPIRSKGLCPSCREEERRNNGTATMSSLKTSPIRKITDKTKKKKKLIQSIREVYFDYHINRCTASEESGIAIYNPTKANICHLLPKSTHPSLQANLDNYLYLTFTEHETFDKLLFEHKFEELEEKFPISWPIALQRIKKLLPLCTETTNLKREITNYIKTKES